MVDERTEEEQIEAVKAWWKRNGTSLLLGIGLAVALLVGWQAWQNHQIEGRMAATTAYQELFSALNTPEEEEGHQASTVTYTAGQLRTEHGGSVYAVLGSLLEAGYLVETGKAADAIASLEWALEHAGEDPLPLIVRERLARAQFIAGESDQALETLNAEADPGVFAGTYHELRGDILKRKGDLEGARAAYREASELLPEDAQSPLLDYKMADLAIREGA